VEKQGLTAEKVKGSSWEDGDGRGVTAVTFDRRIVARYRMLETAMVRRELCPRLQYRKE
jgi:hypothetical protein